MHPLSLRQLPLRESDSLRFVRRFAPSNRVRYHPDGGAKSLACGASVSSLQLTPARWAAPSRLRWESVSLISRSPAAPCEISSLTSPRKGPYVVSFSLYRDRVIRTPSAAEPRSTVPLSQRGMSAPADRGILMGPAGRLHHHPSPRWGAPFGEGSLLHSHLYFFVQSL